MIDPLLAFRPEFPILERATYLVSHSLGAMPRGVADRLAEYVDEWAEYGVQAWGRGWWDLPLQVGSEIAPLIGAAAGEVVMLPNVTTAQAAVLSSLDYAAPRDKIVMTALDFPSVRYVYDRLATRLGARVEVVPSEDGIGIDTERLLAAIDEQTRLVSISYVLFRSAFVMDVDAVCRRAREVGAFVCLDAFHAVGILPVEVKRSGVDFLTGGVLKWLCGGPGGSFLYVAPTVREKLEPALTGWLAHANPFGFEEDMHYANSAYRWLSGTPAVPALYAALEGPRIIRRAGVERIREKSVRQTALLIDLADARGYAVTAPRDSERRGGTVAFDVPHASEIERYLLANQVIVDYRPKAGIRIAPHFYTSDDELHRAVALIDHALETSAWQEQTPIPSAI